MLRHAIDEHARWRHTTATTTAKVRITYGVRSKGVARFGGPGVLALISSADAQESKDKSKSKSGFGESKSKGQWRMR